MVSQSVDEGFATYLVGLCKLGNVDVFAIEGDVITIKLKGR